MRHPRFFKLNFQVEIRPAFELTETANMDAIVIRDFMIERTKNMVSTFKSRGPTAGYEELLDIVLQFETYISQAFTRNVIDEIPFDVLKEIYGYCDVGSALILSTTCKRLSKAITEDIWKEKALNHWDKVDIPVVYSTSGYGLPQLKWYQSSG